jgi:predicted  nucleic acid-binding Zn-ribbon protein
MADPLSIAASVIAVAGLAFSSSKALFELISTIHDAPSVFRNLNQDITALGQILDALRTTLSDRAATMSEGQMACLRAVEQPLEGCDLACKDFRTKVEGLTIHSRDGKRSLRDGVKLRFQSKSIEDFQTKIASWKASLALALDVVSLTSMSADTRTLEALENKMTAAKVQLDADLSKVNTRLEQLLAAEPESEEELQIITRGRESEEQQKASLVQCLFLCQTAADGATQMTGHSFRNNEVFGEGKAVYGDVGQGHNNSSKHCYDSNKVGGKGTGVYGNMDENSFATLIGNAR